MRNRILSITRNIIPYVGDLREIPEVRSCSTAVLMQQLDYWFEKSNGQPFFKFLKPCEHNLYRKGDSWVEEMKFSLDEFRTAFDNIGTRYMSTKEYKEAVDAGGDIFKGKFYMSYIDRKNGITYYFRNHELVDKTLDFLVKNSINELYEVEETKVGSVNLRKLVKPISADWQNQSEEVGKTNSELYTEITTEITTENTHIPRAQEKKMQDVENVQEKKVVEVLQEKEILPLQNENLEEIGKDDFMLQSEIAKNLKTMILSNSQSKEVYLMRYREKVKDATMEDVTMLAEIVANDTILEIMKSEYIDSLPKVKEHCEKNKRRVQVLISTKMLKYSCSQYKRLSVVTDFQNKSKFGVTQNPQVPVKVQDLNELLDVNSPKYSPFHDKNHELYIEDESKREESYRLFMDFKRLNRN